MGFSIERSADVSTLQIIDQLDATDRAELRRAVLGELADGMRTLRIDLARVDQLDSAGVGLLVSISRQATEHAAELRLANLNEDIRTLFMLTKLESLFNIERADDVADAIRAAPAPPSQVSDPRSGPAEERPRP
jgi:anti-sigma B factor antagonist